MPSLLFTIISMAIRELFLFQMAFMESKVQMGRVQTVSTDVRARTVPCFPLHTMLLALNRTTIDFLSLDIEGLELPALKTIPFSDLEILVIAAEVEHGGKNATGNYSEYMKTQGYTAYKHIQITDRLNDIYANDIIFVKNKLL